MIDIADLRNKNIFRPAEVTLHIEKFIFRIGVPAKTDLIFLQKGSAVKFPPDIRERSHRKKATELKFLRVPLIPGKHCVTGCRQHFFVPEPCIIGNYHIGIGLLCHTDISLQNRCIRKIIIRIQKQDIFSLCFFQPLVSRLTDSVFPSFYPADLCIFFFVIPGNLFTLIRRLPDEQKQFPVFVILAYHAVQCFCQIFSGLINRHDHRYFPFFFTHTHFFLTFFHIF